MNENICVSIAPRDFTHVIAHSPAAIILVTGGATDLKARTFKHKAVREVPEHIELLELDASRVESISALDKAQLNGVTPFVVIVKAGRVIGRLRDLCIKQIGSLYNEYWVQNGVHGGT